MERVYSLYKSDCFYTVYSLLFGANVAGGVWLDLMQEIRPYAIIYCTWILNPRFTKSKRNGC